MSLQPYDRTPTRSHAYRFGPKSFKLALRAGRLVEKKVKSYLRDRPKDPKPRKLFPEQNMSRAVKFNPINAQANRMSMKRKGMKNQRVKSTKRVKVSKGLREKVKKVIAGEDAYGAYYTRVGGLIGYIDTGVEVGSSRSYVYGRDSTFIFAAWNGNAHVLGSKVWLSSLCYNSGGSVGSDAGASMTYFTPLKILNAASVLFNQKTPARDPTVVTGNFSLSTTVASGAPNVGSTTFPTTGPLTVRVINSYAVWRMKNVTQRTVIVKVYNCVPKLKFCQSGPLSVLYGTNENVDSSTVRRMMTGTPIPAGGTQSTAIITHPMFEPKMLPAFNQAYKYSCTVMVIKPGEECTHSIQGPKNYTLDYAKFSAQGDDEVGSFYKDTTVATMCSVELDSTVVASATNANGGPYSNETASLTALMTNFVSIEVDEVYKLTCPKNGGFITQNLAAGGVQTLNLKADRIIMANFNLATSEAQTYSMFNEENPGAGIVESNLN